jgi:hypothetical protein
MAIKMAEKKTDKQANPILDVATPNDQRSTVFNPTSSAFKAAVDNRSTQLNPNSRAYHSSRGGGHKK